LPEAPARDTVRAAPVSRVRVAAALAVVGASAWILVSVAGLGPSWKVVVVAAVGSGGAVRFAHGARRLAVVTLVVVALAGLGWIELINSVQYGTLALTGAPPMVRWCGTAYRPSGVITAAPSTGAGPAYSKILRTPSGYDVFGVALGGHGACGTSGAVFVRVGHGLFAAYDP
jgi:hypothetical protein